MQTQFKPDPRYSKCYATVAYAEKRGEEAIAKLKPHTDQMGVHPRFVVVAVDCGEDNIRYTPVFIDAKECGVWLSQLGFCTVA